LALWCAARRTQGGRRRRRRKVYSKLRRRRRKIYSKLKQRTRSWRRLAVGVVGGLLFVFRISMRVLFVVGVLRFFGVFQIVSQ